MPQTSPAKSIAATGEASKADVVEPLWKKVLNDRFTILEPIGVGGMGKVYKAIQAPLDRVVAVKVLSPNGAMDPGFRQRFFLEASLTSKLRHPNTVTVIDYGETSDGIFYLAMEYLDGQPLSQVLASGPLHWTRCLQIGQQICRSLREAHKLGIVHRDLKPANVMLLTEDRDQDLVKVLDFGLVKSFIREPQSNQAEITNPGMLVGSPRYMAPEQLRNQADPRSDVYSLGAVLYEMLVGQTLFPAKDSIDVMFKHMNEPPPPMRSVRRDLDIPKEIEALVMKCLEKQPAWRYQSMDDVMEAMRKAAQAAGAIGIVPEGASIPGDVPVSGVAATPQADASAFDTPTIADRAPAALAIDIEVVPPSAPSATASEGAVAPDLPVVPPADAPGDVDSARAIGSASANPQLAEAPLLRLRSMEMGGASLFANPKVRAALIPASAVAILGMGLIVYLSTRRPPMASKPALPQVQAQAPAPSTAEAKPAQSLGTQRPLTTAVGAKPVTFRIGSDPAGARVMLNGRNVGYTPLSVDVPAGPQGTATAELVFLLRGYQPLAVTAGGSGPEVVLSHKLQPLAFTRPSRYEPRRKEPGQTREVSADAKADEPQPSTPEKSAASADEVKVASVEPVQAKEAPREAPSAPAAPPTAPAVIPFNERMSAPEQLEGRPIAYSREALEAGVQGNVRAKCVINLHGRLENCRIIKSLPFMDKPVLDALATRRYKPILFEGKPVAVEYVFDIKLLLKETRCIGTRCND
jgi:serine/threonine-protein kinase